MMSWLKKEFRKILPVWMFFFISFALLAITIRVTLGHYHIERSDPPEYLVGSLIMAKVVLIVDAVAERRAPRDRPLFWRTLWNTTLYFVVGMTLHYIEEVIHAARRQHISLSQASHQVLRNMTDPTQLVLFVWLVALIFGFCTVRELTHVAGLSGFKDLYFGRHFESPGGDVRKAS